MLDPDDTPTVRARLADAQAALAALRDAPAHDADDVQRGDVLRDEIAALIAALRARGVVVDDPSASAAAQRTVMTGGGSYVEGDQHQQGVFIGGGTIQGPTFSMGPGGTVIFPASQLALTPQEHRNRIQMLAKVRATWMPLLAETLHDVVRMDLGLAANAALVDGPRTRLRQPGQAERMLPPGTPIAQVFDDLAGELLILGDPGSGKTTLLLELARTLLDRADHDPAHPIPVIFNLATWAAAHPPIAAWLVDELNRIYTVQPTLGQAWVEAGALLPLLDGLDEVAAEQRAACVAAINEYHRVHGPLRLVVCSRSVDYVALAAPLQLQGEVVIQPLGMDQIDAALSRAGDRLESVRLAIRDDADLQALATTPLLLSVMIAAYAGRDLLAPGGFATLDARRADLFAAYVDAMFARRGADPRYPRARTLHYLAWLARGMVKRSQTVFYIEQLQPEDLSRWPRLATALGVFLSSMLIGGIGGALAGALIGWLIIGLSNGLRIGWALGLIGGALLGADHATSPIAVVEQLGWSWTQALFAIRKKWLRAVGVGGIVGLIIGFIVERSIGIMGGLIVGLGSGTGGALVGLLGCGLVGGLSGVEISLKTTPNQGIRRSVWNALLAGIVFGVASGLGFVFVFGLGGGFGLKTDSGIGDGLLFGLLGGLIFALLGGMSLGLVGGVLLYGGLTCIKHFILRLLIWRSGDAPWDYAAFLDSAAERILLRKVGGGYIFLHRMLMEYFAGLEQPPADLENGSTST